MLYTFEFFFIMLILPIFAIFSIKSKYNGASDQLLMAGTFITFIGAIIWQSCNGLIFQWSFGIFSLSFGVDNCGKIFLMLFAVIFLLAALFSLEYMEHDHAKGRYTGFYLLTLWSMVGLALAQNMFTYYMCFELMTILSLPLVLHEGEESSIKAGYKYLGYSMFGASVALFGFFCLGNFCDTTDFIAGGGINTFGQENIPMLLIAVFCLLIGFGCKAGIMPLHFWLPTAHPVAPAPASAVLSAAITKAGVLGIIRVIYYMVGTEVLKNTWVQYTMLTLALVTVFTGSMLAYKEKLLKRRFAWSTVSQVSYVLFGIFMLTETGLQAAMLQVVFHAVCKTALFLTAGAIIHHTHCTYVDQLAGVGKKMPILMGCYTLASLSLIGIPPFAGFVSKWQLVTAGMSVFNIFGIVGAIVLLTSAILTAGYLLPITIDAFFKEGTIKLDKKPTWKMILPMIILSSALLILGIFPNILPVLTVA